MTRQGCHHWENHRTEVFVGRETTLEIMLKVHMIYQNYPKLLNVTVVMTVILMFRWNTPRNADRPRDLRSPGLPLMTPGMIFERCRGDMGHFLGATKMSTAHVNSYMNNSYIKLTSFFLSETRTDLRSSVSSDSRSFNGRNPTYPRDLVGLVGLAWHAINLPFWVSVSITEESHFWY